MDEEATIELLANVTSVDNESKVVYRIHDYMRLFFCLLSLTSDLLIVTIMAKNKGANSRTNKLIMHFAIADAFKMIDDLGLFYFIYEKIIYHSSFNRLFCVFVIFEITSLFASFLLVLFLISNTLMKSTRLSDKMLISIYYGIVGLAFIWEICFCIFLTINFHVFHSINFLIFSTAVICLSIKEINRLYKFWKKRPLSQSTAFRMNVARIYVYSCVVNFILYGPNKILILISSLGYLASFFIILYLTYSDRNFKNSLLNLFRFKTADYDADAMISFADECSETMHDVNVTFDGNRTSLH